MNFKISDAGFLFASTVIVNAGNYAINLFLGRILGPELFAEASVIATGVLMLSFLAVGVQLTAAKYSAGYYATGELSTLDIFIQWMSARVSRISIGIAAIIVMTSVIIQHFLKFSSPWPIIIIALGLPFYFNLSLKRGLIQGIDKIRQLTYTYLLEMVLRLTFTIVALALALNYFGWLTTEAVSIGFFFSFLAALAFKKPVSQQQASQTNDFIDIKSDIFKFMGVILAYELSQILINNSDVILAKHYFTDSEAGLYGALALIGRVVFFGTWTIVTLLFPKVIHREKQGLPHLFLFWQSFAITFLFGLGIIVACILFPKLIIGLLFGPDFISIHTLLWKYAVATTLFACANVFAYYYMSLNKYIPVVIAILAGIIQVVGVILYHQSLLQLIYVQIAVMSGLLILMVVYQLQDVFLQKSLQGKALLK